MASKKQDEDLPTFDFDDFMSSPEPVDEADELIPNFEMVQEGEEAAEVADAVEVAEPAPTLELPGGEEEFEINVDPPAKDEGVSIDIGAADDDEEGIRPVEEFTPSPEEPFIAAAPPPPPPPPPPPSNPRTEPLTPGGSSMGKGMEAIRKIREEIEQFEDPGADSLGSEPVPWGEPKESAETEEEDDGEYDEEAEQAGSDSGTAASPGMLSFVVDFFIPVLFPLAIALGGIAVLEGDPANWTRMISQPIVPASLFCFLMVANFAYFTFCLGWVGESYGRLALSSPGELEPQADGGLILKRMLPNLALGLLCVGALYLAGTMLG